MAAGAQEPEITLAQRLASNDKPTRTKALKTLRKYINVRSQKVEGGFTSEDLLKIWKGLFYCLWMQDKPVLQEEISHRMSGLIHSFYTTNNQLLYFTTFLQTVKREWNGIDRLRMDKFFQLVRFMFRQTFEVLKRKEWESSMVNQFLQVFTDQILQNTDHVPKGLMLHILDLYMVELATVASAELTAEQNLTFIDPFCKTMAKTKDRLLLNCISKNIFRTIVDHAPYAIQDLMRELQRGAGDDSDSGQASGEEEEIEEEEELKIKSSKKTKVKKVNGIPEVMGTSKGSTDEEDLDSMGSEDNDDVGPVLQFDYGSIADHLFELGSHLNTRNVNRTKMYNLVKIFRDLSEGIFPQHEDNSDVCDTSDDELFNTKKSKKKKKRKNERLTTVDETVAKKRKGPCQDEQNLRDGEDVEPADTEKAMDTSHAVRKQKSFKSVSGVGSTQTDTDHKPKMPSLVESVQAGHAECGVSHMKEKTKKKKKKKLNMGEEKADTETGGQTVETPPTEISLPGQLDITEKEADETNSQGGDPGQLEESTMGGRKKKRKSKKLCLQDTVDEVAVQTPEQLQKMDKDSTVIQSQLGSSTTKKNKVKKNDLKSSLQEVEVEVKSPAILEDTDKHNSNDISRRPCPTSEEDSKMQCRLKESTTKKKKGKSRKLMSSSDEVGKEVDSTSQGCCAEVVETDVATPAVEMASAEAQPSEALMVRTKKGKKKKAKEEAGTKLQVNLEVKTPEVSSDSITSNKNKSDTAEGSQHKSVKKAKKKKHLSLNDEQPVIEAEKQPVVEAASTNHAHTASKIKKLQKKQSQSAEEKPFLKKTIKEKAGSEVSDTVPSSDDICTPEIKSMKKGKKKRKLQTDEAETSQSNGHAEEEMGGKKVKISGIELSTSVTPKKLKMEKASSKSDFVSFQGLIKPPTPLFYKTKPKGSTPLTGSKQKIQTPKSENKKVTFGLKNNKTTEFRKMDRSLLVSPEGSSRVAFDPKKMPVSGVLKSPSPVTSVKNLAAKKRPTAADFF